MATVLGLFFHSAPNPRMWCLFAGVFLCNGHERATAAEPTIPYSAAIENATVRVPTLTNLLQNALIVGNGDINALLYSDQDGVTLRLTKNDVWDERIDTSKDEPLLKVDVATGTWTGGGVRSGRTLQSGWDATGKWKGGGVPAPLSFLHRFPSPRTCARLVLAGAEDGPAVLDLIRAQATVAGNVPTKLRALAQANVFFIESAVPVQLFPIPDPVLPAADTGNDKGDSWLCQRIPGDLDWAGMVFAVAIANDGPRHAVAIVTSWEAKDPRLSAIRLARETLAQPEVKLVGEHEAIWNTFWSASGVQMQDEFLSRVFYRNLYFLRCVSKPGVRAAGLFAGQIKDPAYQHGDYHCNYDSWQAYWPAYCCNHIELAEPFEQLVTHYLPRARWFARQTYDCGGAHFPISIFGPAEPDPAKCHSRNGRMIALVPYSYCIGQTGWMVQNLWEHYLYDPVPEYLERVAYPAVRDAAIFYADFMDKCKVTPDGKVRLGPSFSPEHRSFGIYNGTCDIVYAKFAFQAAIQAATTLGKDAELVARFTKELARLPDYPTVNAPDPIVTDVEDEAPIVYNIPVPILPVFPVGDVNWFSDQRVKTLFIRTLEQTCCNGNNDSIMVPVARARLSLPDSARFMKEVFLKRACPNGTLNALPLEQGHGFYTEEFAAAGAVAELLLQSAGGVVRVWPAWPKDHDASFVNLRAQGGFLVSAEIRGGVTTVIRIKSTVGGKLRLLNPWTGKILERSTTRGETLVFSEKSAVKDGASLMP